MDVLRVLAASSLAIVLVLVGSTAGTAPRSYVLTGKFTSNRGTFINIPMIGNTPCAGTGLSNLRIMSGPGLTGILMSMQPNPTPLLHPFSHPANNPNGTAKDFQCAGFAPGKVVTTTGAGVRPGPCSC